MHPCWQLGFLAFVPSRVEAIVNAVVFGDVFIFQVVQFLPLAKPGLLKDFECEAAISMLLDSSSELVCSVCFVFFSSFFDVGSRTYVRAAIVCVSVDETDVRLEYFNVAKVDEFFF